MPAGRLRPWQQQKGPSSTLYYSHKDWFLHAGRTSHHAYTKGWVRTAQIPGAATGNAQGWEAGLLAVVSHHGGVTEGRAPAPRIGLGATNSQLERCHSDTKHQKAANKETFLGAVLGSSHCCPCHPALRMILRVLTGVLDPAALPEQSMHEPLASGTCCSCAVYSRGIRNRGPHLDGHTATCPNNVTPATPPAH